MRKTFLKVSFWSLMALGMATSFTACKDYDDDIDQLRKEVAANADAIKQINSLISSGSVITDVTSNANGIVIKLSNGKEFPITNGKDGQPGVDGVNGTVWTIGEDGFWYKDGVKTDYKALGEDGKDATGEAGSAGKDGIYYRPNTETGCFEICNADGTVKEQTDIPYTGEGVTAVDDGDFLILSNVKDADGKFTTVTISKSGALRGLVFVPDGYLEGIEATKYPYLTVNSVWGIPQNTKAKDVTVNGIKYNIPVNGQYASAALADNKVYSILSDAQVTYQLNPENANVKNATFAFITMDAEKYSRAAQDINVVGKPEKNDDGDLVVTYNLSESYLFADEDNDYAGLQGDANTYNMMALTATLGEGEVVTSDYALIIPVEKTFAALAFKAGNVGTTTAADGKDLYISAEKAINALTISNGEISGGTSLDIAYNVPTTDLANLLVVHFGPAAANGKHAEAISLADACKKYNLTADYALVAYTAGSNKTSEDQFGSLNGSVFSPAYVNNDGTKVVVTSANEANNSSIGRHPMVLVTLTDADDNIVLAGYFIINLTAKAGVSNDFIVTEATKPFICNNSVTSTWQQITGIVLSQLNISEANFRSLYTYDNTVAVKVGDKFVTSGTNNGWPTYKEGNATKAYDFGTLTWGNDAVAGTTNPSLTWEGNNVNAAAIYAQPNHTITLYAPFDVQGSNDKLYLGVTITILDKPEVTFGVQNGINWVGSALQLNVYAPSSDASKPVTDFNRVISNFYKNDVVKLITSNSNYKFNLPAGDATKGEIKYAVAYAFTTAQPGPWSGNGATYTLYLKNNGTAAAPNYDTQNLYCQKQVGETKTNAIIATLNSTTGAVNYLGKNADGTTNTIAQEVLNLFAATETDITKQTYANVVLTATYGDCKIVPTMKDNTIQTRWIRPLTIAAQSTGSFKDGETNGSKIALGSFFQLQDFLGNNLIKTDKNKDGVVTGYSAVTFPGSTTDTYAKYYDVQKVTVNLAGAQIKAADAADTAYEPLSTYTNLNLSVSGSNPLTVTAGAFGTSLMDTQLVWTNSGALLTSDQTVRVPVSVEYSWGTVTGYVAATVKKTDVKN